MKPLTSVTALLDEQRARQRDATGIARLGPRGAMATGDVSAADVGTGVQPDLVDEKLAELALLHGVPFEYLVPDARLLPAESIRLFRVDPAWIGWLHDGVLAVGEPSTLDRDRRLAGDFRGAVDVSAVRDRRRGRAVSPAPRDQRAGSGRAGHSVDAPITGFLLRSTAVTDFPGLQVRGYDDADAHGTPLTILRLDRPSPGTLLVLFAGTVAAIVIEEPHHGIRLGVDQGPAGPVVQLRQPDGRLVVVGGTPVTVDVPLRAGTIDGVVDVTELAQSIEQAGVTGIPAPVTGAVLALQLLQPPVRQRFRVGSP